MATEFKFKDNAITLKLEGETFRVFPERLADCLLELASLMNEAGENISAEAARELCGKIALELNRAFNADRAIERIFENAGREMNLADMSDIVNYISAQAQEFAKKRSAGQLR